MIVKKHKEMIYDIIQDTLHVSKELITHIKRTPGGETNTSYFITVGMDKYVVRLPGKGTDQLINRYAEKECLVYVTMIGINPELVYFDVESGVKITRQIDGATQLTPESVRQLNVMKDIVHLFQQLHKSQPPMNNDFNLFAMISHYEKLVYEENSVQSKKLAPLKLAIWELKNVYDTFHVKQTPCHIDAACSNILKDKNNRLYLIDWEYSGMFDPLWDIATLSLSLKLTEEEEKFFLAYYFGYQPVAEEIQRLHLLKIFLDYNWSLWYFYKEAKGDDHGNKGMERINRAEKHLTLYRILYDDNPVVS